MSLLPWPSLALLLAACSDGADTGGEPTGDDTGTAAEVVLSPDTVLPEEAPSFQSVTVEADRLVFQFFSPASEVV